MTRQKLLLMVVFGGLGTSITTILTAFILRYELNLWWTVAFYAMLLVYSWFIDDMAEWVIRRRG